MQRVRITFLDSKGGVIKSFDREAGDADAVAKLADQISTDAGISYTSWEYKIERRCLISLVKGGRRVEVLETRALDEADAKKIALLWASKTGFEFDSSSVAFV